MKDMSDKKKNQKTFSLKWKGSSTGSRKKDGRKWEDGHNWDGSKIKRNR